MQRFDLDQNSFAAFRFASRWSIWKRYTLGPSTGTEEYWTISGVPVLPKNVTSTFFRSASVIQKLTILEHKNGVVLSKNGVVLSNNCVPVPRVLAFKSN